MGTFVFRGDLDFIKKGIDDFIKEEGFRQYSSLKAENEIRIFAEKRTKKFRNDIRARWILKKLNGHTSVQVDIIPPQFWRTFCSICYIITAVLFPYLAWSVINVINKKTVNINLCYLMVFVVLACTLSIFLIHESFKEDIKRTEANFKNFIFRRGAGVIIKSQSDVELTSKMPKIAAASSFFLSTCYFSFLTSKFLLIPFLVISVLLFSQTLLSTLVKKHPALIWKKIMMDYIQRWMILNFLIVAFFVLLALAVTSEFYSYETHTKKNQIHFNEVTDTNLFKEYASLDYKDVFLFRRNLIKEAIDNRFNEIKGDIPWPLRPAEVKADMTFYYFEKTGFIAYFLNTAFLFLTLLLLGRLLLIPQDWRLMKAEVLFVPIKPPPISAGRSNILKYFNMILLVMFILFWIINYVGVFLGIELTSFMFSNKTIFLREISSLLSWIPTSFSFGELDLLYSGETRYLFYTKSFLAILISPFLLLLYASIRRVFKRGIGGIKRKNEFSLQSKELGSFPKETCRKLKLKVPKIIIVHNDKILVRSTRGFLNRKARIYIEKDILHILSEEELKAVIAHELAHIKYDLKKISLLKFFSGLALFPNSYLLLLLDYREMELNADRTALAMVKNKAALERAVRRLSLLGHFTEPAKEPKKSRLKAWISRYKEWSKISNNFFNKDVLIGYAHPEISERIKSISRASVF